MISFDWEEFLRSKYGDQLGRDIWAEMQDYSDEKIKELRLNLKAFEVERQQLKRLKFFLKTEHQTTHSRIDPKCIVCGLIAPWVLEEEGF